MRIKRVIIIPAILALGAAGAVMAGSAAPLAAAHAPAAHTSVLAADSPYVYHGL